jgi:hypothetical protein
MAVLLVYWKVGMSVQLWAASLGAMKAVLKAGQMALMWAV